MTLIVKYAKYISDKSYPPVRNSFYNMSRTVVWGLNNLTMSKLTELPIDGFKDRIVEAVKNNPVTIIVAETGAGKSTRVPFMVMMGLGRPVIVTEPRRLAAESLATRVTEETGLVLGGLVGYQTAVDGKNTEGTLLLYCTDGLHLVR